jgi:hypothetical protein
MRTSKLVLDLATGSHTALLQGVRPVPRREGTLVYYQSMTELTTSGLGSTETENRSVSRLGVRLIRQLQGADTASPSVSEGLLATVNPRGCSSH